METYVYSRKEANFSAIKYAERAAADKDIRASLQFIRISNGLAVATDGHRIHTAKLLESMDNGNYEIVTSTQSKIVLRKAADDYYPDWERVVANTFNISEEIEINRVKDKNVWTSTALWRIARSSHSKDSEGIRIDYLADANPGMDSVVEIHDAGSIAIRAEGTYARIMAFRL